jgi:hypothetical protein
MIRKGPGYWGVVITRLDASQIPQTSSIIMSSESPIYISSTESSPASTPATSRESSPAVDIWPQGPPSWPDPEALPFQEQLDLWTASTNPRPTSEEVRTFIREVGQLFQYSLRSERDSTRCLHEKCNDVSESFLSDSGCR